jgi:hypothetical protein
MLFRAGGADVRGREARKADGPNDSHQARSEADKAPVHSALAGDIYLEWRWLTGELGSSSVSIPIALVVA